jgi:hypothetical protein
MSNDAADESFLSRWSRQKRRGTRTQPAAGTQVGGTLAAEEVPEVDPATLPKIEDLTAESDVSVFLRKGVPEALQKLALRRMWSLDPEIRDFVEVAENQFNFHVPGGIHGLFEELGEGADVSVWLAQATQSVAREKPKEPAEDAPVENSEKLAAVQHDAMEAAGEVGAGEPLSDAQVNAGDDATQDTQQAEAAKRSSAVSAGVARRRHGGALPA